MDAGKNNACPHCRHVVVEQTTEISFDAPSIWKAICEQPPERLNQFMSKMWLELRVLWQHRTNGEFTIAELLAQVIIPALVNAQSPPGTPRLRDWNPFEEAFNLIAVSWMSEGRPSIAIGLGIPLVRLARLMANASKTLPKWMFSAPRINRLFWNANVCLSITQREIPWDCIMTAARQNVKDSEHLFPLLQLYTMLISHVAVRDTRPISLPLRRHEIMNFVVEQCCRKIGGEGWSGRPSNEFKDVLVEVYQELRRYHFSKGKPSLRGQDGEPNIVKGLWALADWSVAKNR